ncbi:MAG: S9 family peptidase [Opitutus sp.]|nr:S9 family peptidase [Opitutus sp.]
MTQEARGTLQRPTCPAMEGKSAPLSGRYISPPAHLRANGPRPCSGPITPITPVPRFFRNGLLAATLGANLLAAEPPQASAAPTPPPPPTTDQLFGLPNLRQPRLSPDGKKIAFLFPHEKRLALGIFDRATNESRMILRGADESLHSFFWKGNDRIVFEADVSGNESFFVGSTDLSGKNVLRIAESQRIENNLTGDFAGIIASLPNDPERIAVIGFFAGNIDNATFVGGAPIIARLNVRNRGLSPLLEIRDSDRHVSFVFDRRGALRLRSRLEGPTLIWEHRPDDHAGFKRVAAHPFHGYAETWSPQFFAADHTTLWLISREEHDRGALYALDTRTFTRGAALFVPPEGEITDVFATPDRTRLLGVRHEAERGHHHWFDAERGALHQKLENTFTGSEVRISSESEDQNVKLIWVGHDREPGTYFVFDQKAGSLVLFKRTRDIDPNSLRPRKPITYTARDGLTIHGYLTLPAEAEPPAPGSGAPKSRRVPLVIHPHGGPFGARDSWVFDNDAQFLATRGYAVLQPNYRGSGGYGREFINQGRQQWGRAMQDDLSDAVKWAVDQGIADPARVAIYGASYGGYAALAGVTLTPELYACAVNYVGAADLEITFKHRGDDAWRHDDDFSYQREWVGATRAYRDPTSPVNLVERIVVPTLHAYGAADPRVKIDHWSRLESQLKKHHKDYQSIVEGKQGHGFRNPDEAKSFHSALEAFLATNLKDRKATVKVGRPEVIDMPAKK